MDKHRLGSTLVKFLASLIIVAIIVMGINLVRRERPLVANKLNHPHKKIAKVKPRHPDGPNWPPGSNEAQHADAALQWLTAAKYVAEKTQDPQAHQVINFLQGHFVVAQPHQTPDGESAAKVLWNAGGPIRVWLIPMLAGDEKLGSKWERQNVRRAAGASYYPENSWLVLRSESFSSTWKGITLLHEAEHARVYNAEPYDWQDHQIYCEKERDVHVFQNRLMSKLGGEIYAKAQDRELTRMRKYIKEKKLKFGETFPLRGPYDPALDTVFEEALSDYERDFRATHFWLHAVYRLIDEDFKGDREDRKARILYTIYRKNGILTPETQTQHTL